MVLVPLELHIAWLSGNSYNLIDAKTVKCDCFFQFARSEIWILLMVISAFGNQHQARAQNAQGSSN